MSKNSATHQKKVDAAVQIIQNTTGAHAQQADTGWILKLDIANKIVRQAVRRRCQQKQSSVRAGWPAPTNGDFIDVSNDPQNKLYHIWEDLAGKLLMQNK